MTDQEYTSFFNLSSYSGLKAMYIMKLSFENKIAFNRHNLPKDFFAASPEYFYGYIVACTAFGLFDYNIKDDIITVTKVDPIITARISNVTNERVKNDQSWQKEIVALIKYFS